VTQKLGAPDRIFGIEFLVEHDATYGSHRMSSPGPLSNACRRSRVPAESKGKPPDVAPRAGFRPLGQGSPMTSWSSSIRWLANVREHGTPEGPGGAAPTLSLPKTLSN